MRDTLRRLARGAAMVMQMVMVSQIWKSRKLEPIQISRIQMEMVFPMMRSLPMVVILWMQAYILKVLMLADVQLYLSQLHYGCLC